MKKNTYLTAALIFIAGLTLVLISTFSLKVEDMINTPEGYVKEAHMNLSGKYDSHVVYKLKIDKSQHIGLLLWTNNKNDMTVKMSGGNFKGVELLKGGNSTNMAEFTLEPGEYDVLLSGEQVSGELFLFVKKQGMEDSIKE